jgi:outer membrane protein assembly factor BamB
MATSQIDAPSRRSLRLWPGIIAAVTICLARYVLPFVVPSGGVYAILISVVGAAVVLIWWLFFSRAPWTERLGALAIIVAAFFATRPLLHPSIVGGMMGMMFAFFALPPVLAPAFVAWAAVTRHASRRVRWASMTVTVLLACLVWTAFRTEGIKGESGAQLRWRWTPTPEERLLARGEDAPGEVPATTTAPSAPATAAPKEAAAPAGAPAAPTVRAEKPSAPAVAAPSASVPVRRVAEWPGFRGPGRDGVVHGVRIATDWSTSPPVALWRRPVGPGWSSFAVAGDLFYTQEQRGDEELVSCYRVSTGAPVWRHRDATRFWESNGGAGPRATPTVSNGRVYSLGATGIVNALDAATGAVLWSRNAATDTKRTIPDWGLASSPLVVGGVVVVAAAGNLVAYDTGSGAPRWFGPTGGGGYSSPQLATIDGVQQILLMRGARTISVAPDDGRLLWEHSATPGVSIVQPALADNGDVLIASGDAMGGNGVRRVAVTHRSGGWSVEERWASRGLKPYFNDFVVHEGHAYGFDGNILACIDLADGARKWKGGRYGNGQMVLLADEDLLLVISEDGELALVGATPDGYTELARVPALDGKTWNHPVLVRDVLLVRNDREMAAFKLRLEGR